jgi:hypothetical protein
MEVEKKVLSFSRLKNAGIFRVFSVLAKRTNQPPVSEAPPTAKVRRTPLRPVGFYFLDRIRVNRFEAQSSLSRNHSKPV